MDHNRVGSRLFVGDGHNDVSLLMPQLDIPVGLSDLLQRVSLIDDWPDLSRLYSLLEQRHIAREQLRHSIIDRDVLSARRERILTSHLQARGLSLSGCI